MNALVDWGIYSVSGAPISVSTGAASAALTLPLLASGRTARFVRLVCTGQAWVRLGATVTGGAGGDGILINTNDVLLKVDGNTQLAYIQQGSAAVLNVVPVEC